MLGLQSEKRQEVNTFVCQFFAKAASFQTVVETWSGIGVKLLVQFRSIVQSHFFQTKNLGITINQL